MKRLVLAVLLILSCCLNFQIYSQSYGALTTITLRDASGEPLLGANVVITSIEGETLRSGNTDQRGKFHFNISQPAIYEITFIGFRKIEGNIVPAEDLKLTAEIAEFEVSETVVTSQYEAVIAENAIQKVTIINREEIEARGANDLSEILFPLVNVNISRSDIYGANIDIGGVGGANIKILLNGVPLSGRLDNELDISQILLSDVERIEIIEGPQSVVYGSNAMGGVINIITRSRSQEAIKVFANGLYESNGKYNFDVGYEGNLDGHSLLINLGRNFFDGYTSGETLRSVEWNPREQYFGNAAYSKSWSKFKFNFSGRIFREKILNRYDPATIFSSIAMDDHYITMRQQYLIDLNYPFRDNQGLSIQLSYSNYKRRKNTYVKDLLTLTETLSPSSSNHDTSMINNWYANFQYNWKTRDGRFAVLNGFQLDQESFRGKRIENRKQEILDLGLYTSMRYTPLADFEIQPALRYTYNSRFKAPLIPSLNIRYRFSKNVSIRGYYSNGFRAPSLKELKLFFVDINHNIQGNGSLKAERGNYYSLIISSEHDIKKHRLSFELEGVLSNIKDKIDLVLTEASGNLYTYENLEELRNRNLKFKATYNIDQFSLNNTIGINWQKPVKETDKYFSNIQLGSEANYTIKKIRCDLHLYYNFQGRTNRYLLDTESGEIETYEVEPYHWLDLTLSKDFWKERIRFNIGLKNILNVKTVASDRVAEGVHTGPASEIAVGTGITFFSGVRITFK